MGNCLKQSGEYVLTARSVVLKVQATILREISGPDPAKKPAYDEDDVMTELWTWLKNRDDSLNRDELVQLLAVYPDDVQNCCLRQVWPMNSEAIVLPVEELAPSDFPTALLAEQANEDAGPDVDEIYWQCVSKKGFRRLHKVDGCSIERTACASWRFLSQKQALAEKSDKPCLRCWPELARTEDLQSEDSGSQSESSSSGTESVVEVEAPIEETAGQLPGIEEEDDAEVIS